MEGTLQIIVSIAPELVDDLSDAFLRFGALAISLSDAKDEPLFQLAPEEEPLWQETILKALFQEDTLTDPLIEQIKQSDPRFSDLFFAVETVAHKNWVKETQKQFPPQKFGDLWICPEWEKEEFKPDAPILYIAPGLAFGTGTHPTTKLCLEWLAIHPPVAKTVIDYGCGSGILALAAMALGAKNVYATDHDKQALQSTEYNASCNQFPDTTLHLKKTDEMNAIQAEIVLANILANPLIDLAPTLIALLKPGATLVLSGLLTEDIDRVLAAYESSCVLHEKKEQEGWVLLSFNKI